MFDCIIKYFTSGYWTSEAELQRMAFDKLAFVENAEEADNPNPQISAAQDILNRIGWSRNQRYWFNPFLSRIQSLVWKAVKRAFAARKWKAVQLLAADADLSSYSKIAAKAKYSHYFTPQELATMSRVHALFPQAVARFTSFESLFSEMQKIGKPAENRYADAKRFLNKTYLLDQMGVDIDKEVYHALYPKQFWHEVPNWREILAGTDPERVWQALNRLFGKDLLFIKDFLKRAISNEGLPISDEQLQRMINEQGSDLAFLRELRWPAVHNLYRNMNPYSLLFYRLQNDPRLNDIPRNLESYIQFLKDHYNNLWEALATDSFGTQKKEAALREKIEKLIPSGRPLSEILLESSCLTNKRGIALEGYYLTLVDEIKQMPPIRFPGRANPVYLRKHCPRFCAYLERKRRFTDEELSRELKLQNGADLKAASLFFLSRIHHLDRHLSPMLDPFTDEEKRQFLEEDVSEEVQARRLLFASEYADLSSQLGRHYLENPDLQFLVSPTDLALLRQADTIMQRAARLYRDKLKTILEDPAEPDRPIDNEVKQQANKRVGNMTEQMQKDLPRLYPTTIVRKGGLFRKPISTTHSGNDQNQFLNELEKLCGRLKGRNPNDLYMLQEMVTQTTQTYITLLLGQELKKQNFLFKPFKLTPILLSQELREVDSTHIQLTQKYQYQQIDQFNLDQEGLPEQDFHSFDVIYTLVKEGNDTRVELTDWTYQNLVSGEDIEQLGQQLDAAQEAPKPTVSDTVKWLATPVTTPAGWLWSGGRALAHRVGLISAS